MKKSIVILIVLLANVTFLFGQTEESEQSATVDHYAGKTTVDDGFGGTWNVENIVYVAGTGDDLKEHSVYILRRPSNLALGLPDTTNCKNRQVVVYPDVRPRNYFSGREVVSYSGGNNVYIHRMSGSELLVYWWVGWDDMEKFKKIKEVAFWIPAGSKEASVGPSGYTNYERSIKESLRYMTKEEVERHKAYEAFTSQLYKDSTTLNESWYRELYRVKDNDTKSNHKESLGQDTTN